MPFDLDFDVSLMSKRLISMVTSFTAKLFFFTITTVFRRKAQKKRPSSSYLDGLFSFYSCS